MRKGRSDDVRAADHLEAFDRKFKRGCAKLARAYRKSEKLAVRSGAYAFAAEQRAAAEIYEGFAEHGLTMVDE